VGASEALAAEQGRLIVLGFDDGYADFQEAAWPVLQVLRFRATLYAVTGRLGGEADWPEARGVPLLDGRQLAALAAAGVEIGAHGATHRRVAALDEDQLRDDLQRAYQELGALLGRPPRALAYPYGASNPAAERLADEAGFASGWTARGGRNTARTPRFRLRRTLVRGRDSLARFALKVAAGYAGFTEWRMDLRGLP
jgi:peptidoglycan/xylan/chitin deacetylase (PgdA/CDA1 family)